jgi:GT2 family glycosyltransferase
MARATTDATVVVVTYDAMPWIERCLESVGHSSVIVVDCGSRDDTVTVVRSRFPEVTVLEVENRGLAAAWNVGLRANESRYVLLLNADAWLVGDALTRLVDFADQHPRAAIVAPRLLNPNGTLQRSVRGFPTLWRLATEYFFLRKLAPRSRLLNGFYGGSFEYDEPRPVEFVMGACMLVRRDAVKQVGYLDEEYFLFSEETDWCFRFRAAGWQVVFYPAAECVHVGGASHAGRLYRENLRGHLLFFWKHRGRKQAEWARRILLAGARLRCVLYPGERGRTYRDAARWLASGDVATLIAR